MKLLGGAYVTAKVEYITDRVPTEVPDEIREYSDTMTLNWGESTYIDVYFFFNKTATNFIIEKWTDDFDNSPYVKTSVVSQEILPGWQIVHVVLAATAVGDIEDVEPTDLSLPVPTLISPETDSITNKGAYVWYDPVGYGAPLTFEWEAVEGATSYIFEIFGSNIYNHRKELISGWKTSIDIDGLLVTLSPGERSNLYWRVRARIVDATGNAKWSDWSEVRRFYIDVTCPKVTVSGEGITYIWRQNKVGFYWHPVWWEPSQPVTYKLWVYDERDYSVRINKNVGSVLEYVDTLPASKYRWAVRAVDAAGNVGIPSEIQIFYIDLVPPTRVNDLRAERNGDIVTLSWTAPADMDVSWGGGIITNGRYSIKYSNTKITYDTNWYDPKLKSVELSPTWIRPGLTEKQTIPGFFDMPAGSYYFAIKTADESGYWSGISNIATIYIPPNIVASVGNCVLNDDFSDVYVTITDFSVYRENKWVSIISEKKTLNLPKLHNEGRTENIALGAVNSANYSKIRFSIDKVTGIKKATGQTVEISLSTNTFEFPCEFTATNYDIQLLKIYFDLEKSISYVDGKYKFKAELLRILKNTLLPADTNLISDNTAPNS
ncbi:MAG: DUF4382 domain-containing protein, partial [Elusimicrobiota bacterium]